jgi:hypothetical protein
MIKKPYFLVILVICLVFFSKLFYPKPSLFYTLDFGQSDIWNFNYPIKDFLADSLKKGELPFWSKDVGTGFPFFAEGQIGALNLSNLILFYFLPAWLAFNISYIVIFFTSSLGCFFFLKKHSISNCSSLFGSIVFSFSSFFVLHISHFNLIQAASFLPWLFLCLENLMENSNKKNFLLFAFFLSQLIFSGHPQITFIIMLGLGLYFIFLVFTNYKSVKAKIAKVVIFIIALSLGISLSAPQILPSLQLTKQSFRQSGLSPGSIFQYPYPLEHILSFVNPNIFGTPKNGTYPPFNQSWGIYWENTGYVGILPVILLIFFLFKTNKHKVEKFFLKLLILSLLLVWGGSSPLYFLFSFPGFNYFRVPSRFLLLVIFSLTFLAAFNLNGFVKTLISRFRLKRLPAKSFITWLIVIVGFFDLFYFGYAYHPTVSVENALRQPESLQLIKTGERVYTDLGQLYLWNQIFFTSGWQNIDPFLYFKNGLAPDLNLIYDIPNINAFYGLPPKRQQFYQQSLSKKLIDLASAKYIIITKAIAEDLYQNVVLINTIHPSDNKLPDYFIYQNNNALPRFRLITDYIVEKTSQGALIALNNPDFSASQAAVLESDLEGNFSELTQKNIAVIKDADQEIILNTQTDKKSLLLIADSFYPEWKAKINGQTTEILPANINQKAIILPPGKNKVEIFYSARSFKVGLIFSCLGCFLFIVIYNKFYSSKSKSGAF